MAVYIPKTEKKETSIEEEAISKEIKKEDIDKLSKLVDEFKKISIEENLEEKLLKYINIKAMLEQIKGVLGLDSILYEKKTSGELILVPLVTLMCVGLSFIIWVSTSIFYLIILGSYFTDTLLFVNLLLTTMLVFYTFRRYLTIGKPRKYIPPTTEKEITDKEVREEEEETEMLYPFKY